MNKNAIKKFAIDARNKLIASVTDKAGMLGITPDNCSEAITKGADFEVYKTTAGTEVTLNKKECEQRRKLVDQIHARGFEAVVEEVAYTWFNRICAIRFMEVNDYMYPVRVRVLSSEKKSTVSGLVKNEPDVVTMAPDIDWDFTDKERKEIIDAKMNNRLDDLFRMLFIKQCNLLHEVLPGLFEETEDYTEMLLNISFTNEDDVIRMLVDGIDEKDFNITTVDEEGKAAGQVEIIGWLYQYYNTEPKNKAFAKKGKITKEEVPAVTQLFTPDWIVRYMVENSLGRMWVEGHPDDELKSKWKYYLDEAEQEESVQQELGKIKAEYATLKPEDIKLIDPCMGSGHILVYAFDVFMQIYENAGWSQRDAAQSIIQNNIYGLDIDDRAAQLSYFAVLMKARQYDRRILTRGIEPNVYAVQESNGINRGQLKYFGAGLAEEEKKTALLQMEGLLNTLNDAKEYGSLLNVEDYDWELLEKFVENTNAESQISFDTYGLDETAEQLKRLIRIGKVMAQKYQVVATNPPYMGGSMNKKLYSFVDRYYRDAKSDMYTAFIERANYLASRNAKITLVTPETWMFLESYNELRRKLLTNYNLISLCHLGTGAFDAGFGTVVFCYKKRIGAYNGIYVDLKGIKEKERIENWKIKIVCDKLFKNLPNNIIAYWCSENMAKVFNNKKIGECFELESGIVTGNNTLFLRFWYETSLKNTALYNVTNEFLNNPKYKWFKCNKGGGYRKWYGNYDYVVDIGNNAIDIKSNIDSSIYRLRNRKNYFLKGINWPLIGVDRFSAKYTPYDVINNKAANSIHFQSKIDKNLFAYLNSKVYNALLLMINPTVNYPLSNIASSPYVEVDFDFSDIVDECLEISKEDYDSFEYSSDFKRHFLCTKIGNWKIKELYNSWEEKMYMQYERLVNLEEKINKIYIHACGLENELDYKVDHNDIGIRVPKLKEDVVSFISYSIGCMLGRYSLDEEGLIYAGGECDYGRYKTFLPDEDNCIPITDEEYFSDDIVARFIEFVKIVYGADTLEENLDFIANVLGNKGNTSREVIRNYFLKDFYTDHLKVYQKRPIYWMFDSGKQNGFKALIYMHRYDADTVGRVRTDYLHKAQKYVETAMQSAQYTIDNATSASEKSKATKAVTKYTKQLAEMKIYDEAIAHVANQRIEIDLDDGVKVNYAKFQGVEVAQEGRKALKVDLLAKI